MTDVEQQEREARVRAWAEQQPGWCAECKLLFGNERGLFQHWRQVHRGDSNGWEHRDRGWSQARWDTELQRPIRARRKEPTP